MYVMTNEQRQIVQNEVDELNKMTSYSYDAYVEFVKKLVDQHPLSYFNLLMSKRFKVLWDDIREKTKFLDAYLKPNIATRVFYYINKLDDIKHCETCGKAFLKQIPAIGYDCYFCCNKCAQTSPSIIAKVKDTKFRNHGDPNWNNMEKNKQTCLERYGVEYSWQAKEVQDKARQSIRDRYGVDHQMHSQEVKDGMKARYKAVHGVEYAFQNPEVRAKIKAKNQANLGVDWPMQSKELHKIMNEHAGLTQSKNFFNNVLSKDPQYEALFTLDEWLKYGRKDYMHPFLWRCRKCSKTFISRVMWGSATYVRCYDCFPVLKNTSQFEKDIASYVKSIGEFEVMNHVPENKQVIAPKEIDVIVKDKHGKIVLGIEADGLYWHSISNGNDKLYHLMKTDECLSKGIQLVHVFEDEWTLKNSIAKARIASILGIYSKRIYARQCTIDVASAKDAKEFFNANHLQGWCAAKVTYALSYSNENVAMMSFGSKRKMMNGKNENGSWELLRFACKCGVNVIGGASKLLSHFEKDFKPKKLLSYADRRWSIGKLYEALGFNLDHVSAPSYWYLDNSFSKRIYRYAFAKSKQEHLLKNFDPCKTEMENMASNGYSWIWDCGNYAYMKTYS